jgi:hypothetical protein
MIRAQMHMSGNIFQGRLFPSVIPDKFYGFFNPSVVNNRLFGIHSSSDLSIDGVKIYGPGEPGNPVLAMLKVFM